MGNCIRLTLVWLTIACTAYAEQNLLSKKSTLMEQAILGGGCFWCTEAVFETLEGVTEVESGYMGGAVPNPSYEQVCTGKTGHAEVIRITFDPSILTFSDLLDLFWEAHDPTTLNRQGADVGTQYRSVIFFTNDQQKQASMDSIQRAQVRFNDPIVTEVTPASDFYPAEDYHQNFYTENTNYPYCRAVITPKLKKLAKRK
ncbi:MAG: peptide-methionine (S)-S-oxide reductase MsrA [Opitutales bacterium]|nr:peptide-methionine (S)-S-oxide reductase MsrA [Opitutales bacterium]